MLPKKYHPQDVLRVYMPAAHSAQLKRLSDAVDKINARKICPRMRVTQVGSWPWRHFLKQYLISKGARISDAMLAVLDSGDWDLRIEPVDDTITLVIPQLVAFVEQLLQELGLEQEVPFQFYFNMKWELADVAVQLCQIKPINSLDVNLDIEGRILFDDTLYEMKGTHQSQFMTFIEKREIITSQIFSILRSYEHAINQKTELSYLERSRLYFLIKSYIKPLKLEGAHFHENTSQAWCDFMMLPQTKEYYKGLQKHIVDRYKVAFDDYKAFESAVKLPYLKMAIPRLHALVEQLQSDLSAYKAVEQEDFQGIDLSIMSESIQPLNSIEQVYDLDQKLHVITLHLQEKLSNLKQKKKAESPTLQPVEEQNLKVSVKTKAPAVKVSPHHSIVSSADDSFINQENMQVNALKNTCITFIKENLHNAEILNGFSHIYQSLWDSLFIKQKESYEKLTSNQKVIFLTAFVKALCDDPELLKEKEIREVMISYFLIASAELKTHHFYKTLSMRKYVSGFYTWFALIKPFGQSETTQFMIDFLNSHEFRFNLEIKEKLLHEFTSMQSKISYLNEHEIVKRFTSKPLIQSPPSVNIVPRILAYIYREGTPHECVDGVVLEGVDASISFHSHIESIIQREIVFHQASQSLPLPDKDVVLIGECFIRNILAHAEYVKKKVEHPEDTLFIQEFIDYFKLNVSLYRALYSQIYQERSQVHYTMMPLLIREAILVTGGAKTLELIFKSALVHYKKSYPHHEPSIEDLNIYSLPTINSAIDLGNLLHKWEVNKPKKQKPLYVNYMVSDVNRLNLTPVSELMNQLYLLQQKEPIQDFDIIFEKFISFIAFHKGCVSTVKPGFQ